MKNKLDATGRNNYAGQTVDFGKTGRNKRWAAKLTAHLTNQLAISSSMTIQPLVAEPQSVANEKS